MLINVGLFVNQPIGSSRDFSFDIPNLTLSDLEMHDLSGVAHISRTPQGLLVEGDFTAGVGVECVRCLTEYRQTLRTIFDELFLFKSRQVDESALLLPDDGYIDLAPLLWEYMLIEVPISPLCKENCKGLCPVCGEDLNENPHEHPVDED